MTKLVMGRSVYLRKLDVGDLDRTWEWLHRPAINARIGVQVPFSKEQQMRWYSNLHTDRTKVVMAICLNEGDAHIGNVSLARIDLRHRNARLSIFIADALARGKGYGSEALCLLEQYAFDRIGLHKIWCKADAGVPALVRFYERQGFRQEGLLKAHECKNGVFVDKVLFAKVRGSGDKA